MEYKTEEELKTRATILLERFINDNYTYFSSFDRVVLYYDNGQKQLASALQDALSKTILAYERKLEVSQGKYKLLQVADMLCTLALLQIKCENNSLSESEIKVFHSKRDLKKEFLKKIKSKEFN